MKLKPKRLIEGEFVDPEYDDFCPVGALMSDKMMATGNYTRDQTRDELREYPYTYLYIDASYGALNLVQHINDDKGPYNETAWARYKRMLEWVRSRIVR